LRDICEKLSTQLLLQDEYKKDDKAICEINYLNEMSRVNKITKEWAKSRVTEIEAKTGLEVGFLIFVR
jgi:hypothetical protein